MKKKEGKILNLARQQLLEEFGSECRLCDSQCSECGGDDLSSQFNSKMKIKTSGAKIEGFNSDNEEPK